MATSHVTHDQREQIILTDLEASFPHFTGQSLSWTKVPDGQDPPDFLSCGRSGPIGLELIEWLDGGQMGPAKGREAQRNQILRILRDNWENEYKPQNFRGAFFDVGGGQKVAQSDEAALRQEFLACSADVERTWFTNPERTPNNAYYHTDFSNYPVMGKYLQAIRYIGGDSQGLCWIHEQGDGSAFDPSVTIATMEQALDKKLTLFSTPATETKLNAHGLTELYLLVHGGFNAFAYNTPSGPLFLEDIAQRGAAFYAAHAQRQIFNRVWFFDSLDSADDINQLIGYPAGYGRVRWLAQLWPDFRIYPGSSAA